MANKSKQDSINKLTPLFFFFLLQLAYTDKRIYVHIHV